MKRVIALLALLLVAWGSVFAQQAQQPSATQQTQQPSTQPAQPARPPAAEFKFSGFLSSTFGYDIENDSWGGREVMIDNQPSTFLYYTRLIGDWSRQNVGFSFAFNVLNSYDIGVSNAAGSATGMPYPSLHWGYGHITVLDNTLQVKMGKIRDDTYNSGAALNTDGQEGGRNSGGVLVHYRPIPNFSVGAGVYIPTTGAKGDEVNYSFGAYYVIPNLLRFAVAGGADAGYYNITTGGITLLAVPNLRAAVEIVVRSNRKDDPHPTFVIDQLVNYRLDDLTLGLTVYQFLNNGNRNLRKGGLPVFDTIPIPDNTSARLGFSIDPYATYRLGAFYPRLGLSFENYAVKQYTPTDREREDERFIISVKPSIAFRAGQAQIELGYTWIHYIDTQRIAGRPDATTTSDSNVVQLTFNLSM